MGEACGVEVPRVKLGSQGLEVNVLIKFMLFIKMLLFLIYTSDI